MRKDRGAAAVVTSARDDEELERERDEGAEVELDAAGEALVPGEEHGRGEPSVGEAAEELLSTRPLRSVEPAADALEVPENGLDLPTPNEEEGSEEHEEALDEVLVRTVLREDLESRYEELDEQEGPEAAEPKVRAAAPGGFVCSRCFLRKHRVQLADAQRQVCRDCLGDS